MPPPFAEVSDHPLRRHERAGLSRLLRSKSADAKGVLWRRALGFLTYEPSASLATADTIFDLASLTKVLATTSLAMRAIDDGRLRLEDPVARWIPEWSGNDREERYDRGPALARIGSDRLPAFLQGLHRPDRLQPAICGVPLEYRAADAVDLQRPGIHAPRIRSGGRTAAERQLHGSAGCQRSRTPARRAIPTACNVPHPGATGVQPAAKLAGPHGADGGGSVARAAARRRGPRREHVGARRRRGSCWPVRNGRRRWSVRPRRARNARRCNQSLAQDR